MPESPTPVELSLENSDGGGPGVTVITPDGPRPVIVVIGGADELSGGDRDFLRPLFDRGLGAAAERVGAVVITGGTKSGVMELVGTLLGGRPGVTTVGVAPGALVVRPNSPGGTPLDPNHDYVVLSSGHTWGSETEALFRVAESITADSQPGVVVLANGGPTARHETMRFLDAGWPTVCLAGSGREADALASQVRRTTRRRRLALQALGVGNPSSGWQEIETCDIEVHPAKSSPELLFSRLYWRLSPERSVKNAWNRWAAFDVAAQRSKRATVAFQMGILVLTVGLIVLSVLFGKGELKGMRPLIIVLPVAIALSTGLAEALVPARRWATLRAAAEAIQRAIYRCWSSRIPVDGEEADETTADVIERATDRPSLTEQIIEIDQFVLRSGVALVLVNPIRGRPDKFPASFDEFATLTVRGYMEERLDEQLRYYRRRATVMRARESVAVAASVAQLEALRGRGT